MSSSKKLAEICCIRTGKLDSNQFALGGQYPFFTCAPTPLAIDSYAFDDDVILIAGNNAGGNFHLNRYAEAVWQIIGEGNRYVDAQKPWALKKEDPARMNTVLYSLCECIRQIAILTQPILPVASAKISAMLGQEKNDFSMLEVALRPGLKIDEPLPLFAKYV